MQLPVQAALYTFQDFIFIHWKGKVTENDRGRKTGSGRRKGGREGGTLERDVLATGSLPPGLGQAEARNKSLHPDLFCGCQRPSTSAMVCFFLSCISMDLHWKGSSQHWNQGSEMRSQHCNVADSSLTMSALGLSIWGFHNMEVNQQKIQTLKRGLGRTASTANMYKVLFPKHYSVSTIYRVFQYYK